MPNTTPQPYTDETAIQEVWSIMDILNDDEQWSPDTLDDIAQVLMMWKTGETNVLAAMVALEEMRDD